MPNDLFRKEVMEARRASWLGGISLAQPLRLWVLTLAGVTANASVLRSASRPEHCGALKIAAPQLRQRKMNPALTLKRARPQILRRQMRVKRRAKQHISRLVASVLRRRFRRRQSAWAALLWAAVPTIRWKKYWRRKWPVWRTFLIRQ